MARKFLVAYRGTVTARLLVAAAFAAFTLLLAVFSFVDAADTTISNFDVAAQANKTIRLKDNTDGTWSYATWPTGDGTNFYLTGTTTNLAAGTATNAQLVTKPGMWQVNNTSAAAGTASAAKAAGGAGVKLVLDSVTVSLGAGAAAQGPVTATVVQDAAGTPVTLWTATLAAPANSGGAVSVSGLNIISTVANKTLTVAFGAAGAANTVQSVSMSGYLAQ